MIRSALSSITWSGAKSQQPASTKPNTLQSRLAPFLEAISRRACTHPIHTIAFVAVLASTTYIGLLENSLFEPPATTNPTTGDVDVSSFLTGSRSLHAGIDTDWKWQNGDDKFEPSTTSHSQQLALLTLVFPDTVLDGDSVPVPQQSAVSSVANGTSKSLPSSKNLLSPISQETTLAYSIPLDHAGDFISSLHEFTVDDDDNEMENDLIQTSRDLRWIMSATREGNGSQRTFRRRVSDAWIAFVDLLKNAEELDIVIMVLGYLSMHLTFVSLFMSLRRLGSHFWLGTTVLLSSVFALLFGLMVTIKLGVPLNMVLLSEGLPFLVVTIGFEKPIVLTKAVLSAALTLNRPRTVTSVNGREGTFIDDNRSSSKIQSAIQIAVREKGFEIVRDYCIEILILVAGAASGVQGGLCQFCFLAAWILFFDCILLFTFYTSILTIKLEINRIKRHVSLRRALEEDGVSRRVAEEVASSDEWPRMNTSDAEHARLSKSAGSSVFGMKARDSSVAKFKVLMVLGFVAINLVNFATIPFRSGIRSTGSALSSAVTQPPMDPFKVASNGLNVILANSRRNKQPTSVMILTPIRYELEVARTHSGTVEDSTASMFDLDFADQLLEGMGGRVVEGILKSFEDPFLSKWIIIALAMSLVLNGYLFNAARWTIKEPSSLAADDMTSSISHKETLNSSPTVSRDGAVNQTHLPHPAQEEIVHVEDDTAESMNQRKRTQAECEELVREKNAFMLTDEELVHLTSRGKIPGYALEKLLDKTRAVKVRRSVVSRTPATVESTSLLENSDLPYKYYDYDRVYGACCENVIGYLPLPLGLAGPIVIDGQSYFLPMATTEGVLVASTSRGAKAINAGGGAVTVLTGDGMTRGPCVGFSTLTRAGEAKLWLDSDPGQHAIREAFNSTSRFARLQTLKTALAGTYLYIRFKTTTGDAMGMNMISKGVEASLHAMATQHGFDDMSIISVSGNYCTDKKSAAINWIDGRGKSVVAEAIIPGEVVRGVLKSDVNALVELNTSKNLIGSAMAGSTGGFNAHAANIVTAMFIATGQDPAQNVESSSCITTMRNHNGSLQIAVSLPCVEVGTIGGGTFLPPQASMLDLLGVRGAHPTTPGANARQLARIIAAGVLAGELSLCSALAAGHLVRAHMQHNRSAASTRAVTPVPAQVQVPGGVGPSAGPAGLGLGLGLSMTARGSGGGGGGPGSG